MVTGSIVNETDWQFWVFWVVIWLMGYAVLPLVIWWLMRRDDKRIERYRAMSATEKKLYWSERGLITDDDGEPVWDDCDD